MASGQRAMAVRELHALLTLGTPGAASDRELLRDFATHPGAGAERAFAALLARHGPMVLGVCRRVLDDPEDAADAFQATFLVLARKASSVRVRDSLGPWLYGVGLRVARRARAVARRRRRREAAVGDAIGDAPDSRGDGSETRELRALLDAELARLPAAYRDALVLCHLEGRTHDQAARELGWPVGTVRSRLARGRALLRSRLVRRGVRVSAFAGAARLSAEVSGSVVPGALRAATLRGAVGGAVSVAGSAAPGVLARGFFKEMVMLKIGKTVAAALLAVGCLAGLSGVPLARLVVAEGPPPARAEAPRDRPPDAAAPAPSPATPPTPLDHPPGPEPKGPDLLTLVSPRPWETAVRIKLQSGDSIGFGSGTVFQSTPTESWVLTCAHTYRDTMKRAERDGAVTDKIQVDLFDGHLSAADGVQSVRYVSTVDGELLACDPDKDLALLRIRPGRQLPASRDFAGRTFLEAGQTMIAVGCPDGNDATAWATKVVLPGTTVAVTPPTGPAPGGPAQPQRQMLQVRDLRSRPPARAVGRGLFTTDGELAGVLLYADPATNQGLYAHPTVIHSFLADWEKARAETTLSGPDPFRARPDPPSARRARPEPDPAPRPAATPDPTPRPGPPAPGGSPFDLDPPARGRRDAPAGRLHARRANRPRVSRAVAVRAGPGRDLRGPDDHQPRRPRPVEPARPRGRAPDAEAGGDARTDPQAAPPGGAARAVATLRFTGNARRQARGWPRRRA